MLDWLQDNRTVLYWVSGLSILMLVASMVAVPAVLVRLPPDYLARARRRAGAKPAARGRAAHLAVVIGRNLLGALLVLAGVLMLVLPGQGIIAIVLGLLLIDVPGKHRLIRWLMSRPGVLKGVNWLRRRAGRPPLRLGAA